MSLLQRTVAIDMDPEVAHIAADHRLDLFLAILHADAAIALLLVKQRALLAEAVPELPTTTPRLGRATTLASNIQYAMWATPLPSWHRLQRRSQAERVECLAAFTEQ